MPIIGKVFALLSVLHFVFYSASAQAQRCDRVLESRTASYLTRFEELPSDHELRRLFDTKSKYEIRSALLPLIQKARGRNWLDAWLTREFERQGAEVLANKDRPSHVIIGAGAHTLTLIANQQFGKNVIVIDRDVPGSTFYRRQFRLNSSQDIQANDIPGGAFQISDFKPIAEHPEPPMAHDFGFILRLNLRVSGARVLTKHQALEYDFDSSSQLLSLKLKGLNEQNTVTLPALSIGIATGIDNYKNPTIDPSLLSSGQAIHADQFLRKIFQRSITSKTLQNKRIAIVGAKHSAYTVAEAIFKLNDSAQTVMYGLKSKTGWQFAQEATPPKGSFEFLRMIINRYLSGGIPKAIDSGALAGKESRVERIYEGDDSRVQIIDSRGDTKEYDLVILATGADSKQSFWAQSKKHILESHDGVQEFTVQFENGDPLAFALAVKSKSVGWQVLAYAFGPGAALPIHPDRLSGYIANRDSLYVTLPATQKLSEILELYPKLSLMPYRSFLRAVE